MFVEGVKGKLKPTTKTRFSNLFGVSNRAVIMEGGIQVGVSNLDSVTASKHEGLVLFCVINFPPRDEVYFAIHVQQEMPCLIERLDEMKRLGAQDKLKHQKDYSERNNVAAVYLTDNGLLYLRNKGFFDSLSIDLTSYGPGIKVDDVVVSLYPPTASARRSLLAREFIGYLASMVGLSKVHELRVWAEKEELHPNMCRMPESLDVEEIEGVVARLGGHYPDGEVRRLHRGLNFLKRKHFVILAGISGTGKTSLALQYARAVHGLSMDAEDPLLVVCPVRPEWTDPTSLTGYYDVLKDQYVVPPFLEALLTATAHRDSPVFAILDEMNLARVEYYFSDILSCIETNENLQLHANAIPLEGTTGLRIRAEMPFPKNLYIIGTINVDETTNPISDKVLDRAIVIDMTRVDMTGFLEKIKKSHPEIRDACHQCGKLLCEVNSILTTHRLAFGYRVAEEFIRYYVFASKERDFDSISTMDDQLVQKILIKLRGSEKQRPLLNRLEKVLGEYPRSMALLKSLIVDLDEYGSFQTSR